MDPLDISVTGTVDGWLELAEAHVDQRFGEGYAKRHPVLIAGFVSACATAAGNLHLEGLAKEMEALRLAVGEVREAVVGRE